MGKRIKLGIGWVYAIPLPESRYGYFLCVDTGLKLGIIFNCISCDALIRGRLLDRDLWLRPASIFWGGLTTECIKLDKVEFDASKVPLMVHTEGHTWKGGTKMIYSLIGPGMTYNRPSLPPDEVKNYLNYLNITGGETGFTEFVNSHPESFTIINGTGEIPPPPVEEEGPDEVQMEVQIGTGACPVDMDALIGEVEEDMENAALEEFEMVDGSDGEIIVRLPKEDATRAASVIRRILRQTFTPEQIEDAVQFTLYEEGKEPKTLAILPVPRKKPGS